MVAQVLVQRTERELSHTRARYVARVASLDTDQSGSRPEATIINFNVESPNQMRQRKAEIGRRCVEGLGRGLAIALTLAFHRQLGSRLRIDAPLSNGDQQFLGRHIFGKLTTS